MTKSIVSFAKKVGRIAKEEVLSVIGFVRSKCPVNLENKIVFCAYNGKGYCCNPKYIAEEIHRRNLPLDMIWLVKRGEEETLPDYVRPVRYGTLAEQKELGSAKFWVDNARRKRSIPKREGQVYVQAWHGAISPKRIEKDAKSKLTSRYIKLAKRDGRETDVMFANNSLYEAIFKKSFWYTGPVIRCGMPRNEPIVKPNAWIREEVFEKLGISLDKKIVLYAPTFRRNHRLDVYDFDYEACREALEKKFGGEFSFAIRLHPGMTHLSQNLNHEFIDATHYPDAQELLSVVDVLISDYSSIAEDFMLTGRPCFIYAPDLGDYIAERGLYYTLNERPFPVAETEDGLLNLIADYSQSAFDKNVDKFMTKFDIKDDGLGSRVVVDYIERAMTK